METFSVNVATTFATLVQAKLQSATRKSRLLLVGGACCAFAYGLTIGGNTSFGMALAVTASFVVVLKVLTILLSAALQVKSGLRARLTFSADDIVLQDTQGSRSVGWNWICGAVEDRYNLYLVYQRQPRRVVIIGKTKLPPPALTALKAQLSRLGLLAATQKN